MDASTTAANVVLAHGGFVDGSGWRGVYDLLKAGRLPRQRGAEPLGQERESDLPTRPVLWHPEAQ